MQLRSDPLTDEEKAALNALAVEGQNDVITPGMGLCEAIWTLNDWHNWSREKIAAWLRTLE